MKASSLATIASLYTFSVGHTAPVQASDRGIVSFPSLPATTAAASVVQPSPSRPIALSFTPPPVAPSLPPSPANPPTPVTPPPISRVDLFAAGSDSLVARAVGHAEGTRTADGSKTPAYYGHTDPGNGVWNLGSFSFQHCREYNCATPTEADTHQLKRLRNQAKELAQRTEALGIDMTLLEELNGIDLANQAPLAALGQPGYAEWLKEAHAKQLSEWEGVLWARVQSYWDPQLNAWNAPGLGNREDLIRHDQNRRLTAIARSLAVYQQAIYQQKFAARKNIPSAPTPEAVADSIIWQNLDKE